MNATREEKLLVARAAVALARCKEAAVLASGNSSEVTMTVTYMVVTQSLYNRCITVACSLHNGYMMVT